MYFNWSSIKTAPFQHLVNILNFSLKKKGNDYQFLWPHFHIENHILVQVQPICDQQLYSQKDFADTKFDKTEVEYRLLV